MRKYLTSIRHWRGASILADLRSCLCTCLRFCQRFGQNPMRNEPKCAPSPGKIFMIGAVLLASGCQSEGIRPKPAPVMPLSFWEMDCENIGQEAVELSARAHRLLQMEPKIPLQPGLLDESKVAIPWPEIYITEERIEEDNNIEGLQENLSDVRGEMRTLRSVSKVKQCPFSLVRPDRFKTVKVPGRNNRS